MNSKQKITNQAIVGFSIGLILFLVGSGYILLEKFEQLEVDHFNSQSQVVTRVLQKQIVELDEKMVNWFATETVDREQLKTMGVDGVYFFNTLEKKSSSAEMRTEQTDRLIKRYFFTESNLLKFKKLNDVNAGFLKFENKIYIFAGRNVEPAGFDKGVVAVFIKLLNTKEIDVLSRELFTDLNIVFIDVENNFLAAGESQSELTRTTYRQNILFNDYFGRPIFSVNIIFLRPLYKLGMQYIFAIGCLITIIISIFSWLLIGYLGDSLFDRLTFMSYELALIELGLLNSVTIFKNDELTTIAGKINKSMADVAARSKENDLMKQFISQQQDCMARSAKLSSLGIMSASIAHEINNPLMIIRSHAKIIEKELDQNDSLNSVKIKKAIESINRTVSRISKTASSLKNFARDSQCDKLEYHTVSTLISEAVSICHDMLRMHDVQITYENSADLRIYCRPTEITQVFVNLISNSYDAIKSLEDKWINISVNSFAETLEISLTDSGKGIPKEIQSKIMLPFFTTKEFGHGTGLGLSITKQIVERHNGKIKLDDNSFNTKFVLEFPIAG
ncbi:MAG: ATP-binding protein [Pseudobdellovibrio sp.]